MEGKLIEKFEERIKELSILFPIEKDWLIGSPDDCEELKLLGFNENGKSQNWNDWDDEMFSCPSYKQAINWLKNKMK